MRLALRFWDRLLSLVGWRPLNRRFRRRAVARRRALRQRGPQRRRSVVRRQRFDNLEKRVVMNADPIADNGTLWVSEDIAQTGTVSGSDADLDPLTFAVAAGPSNGSVSMDPGGSYLYTPNANFFGSDSFTFTAHDGTTNSSAATISITVAAVNDVPTANDSTGETYEDTPLSAALPTVTDADGDWITYAKASDPAHGTLSISGGSYSYTPEANYNGSDSFTYSISDGVVTNTYTIALNIVSVNDVPQFYGSDGSPSFTTAEDTPFSGQLVVPTDPDGPTYYFETNDGPAHGTLVLGSGGDFTYTPAANYHGADSFSYKVLDSAGGQVIGTGSITIVAVSDLPTFIAGGDKTIDAVEDTAVEGILPTVEDVDGDSVTFAKYQDPAHGTVTVNSNGTFVYTPAADFNGVDTFSYSATDGTYTIGGVVTVNVAAVNDAPRFTGPEYGNGIYFVAEDTLLSAALPGATDPEAGSVTYSKVSDPQSGTLTISSDGSFTYMPVADYNGTVTFSYEVTDGGSGVVGGGTITIYAVNDSPTLPSSGVLDLAVNEDTTLTGSLSAADVDGDPLGYELGSAPAHGTATISTAGSVSYQPAADYFGSDSFTYVVSDGNGGTVTGTVNITINSVNDVPTNTGTLAAATFEDLSTGYTPIESDVEGDTLTYTVVSGAATWNGTQFVYSPPANFNGADSFVYEVNDGHGGIVQRTVTVTVTPVNDAPTAENVTAGGNEDTEIAVVPVGADIDGDSVTYSLATGPANGTVTWNGSSFLYTPNADFNGTDSFTYQVSDTSLASATAVATVTVAAVNDAPVITSQTWNVDENETFATGSANKLTLAAADVDGDALTFTPGTSATTHGSVTISADGSFTYTPEANFVGTDSFQFSVTDPSGATATGEATVQVLQNAIPAPQEDTFVVALDAPVTFSAAQLLANDTDGDQDALDFVEIFDAPIHGTLTTNLDGSFTYTPHGGFIGLDHFRYKVADETDEALGTIWIEVGPLAVSWMGATPLEVNEDESLPTKIMRDRIDGHVVTTFRFSSSDGSFSRDGNPLTATTNVSYTQASDATGFTFTPNANFNGTAVITITAGTIVSGTFQAVVTKTVEVTVNAVNDAPTTDGFSFSGNEDENIGGTVTATDLDGDALSYSLVSGAANGTVTVGLDGTFTFAPNGNFHGTDSFVFRATDANGAVVDGTVSITVTSVNDAPTTSDQMLATDEDVQLSISPMGSDVDGDVLSYAVSSGPTSGEIAWNGSGFTYTPAANYFGSDSVSFSISDGLGGTTTQTFAITIAAVNDPPTFLNGTSGDGVYTMLEDTVLNQQLPSATDPESGSVSYSVASGPQHGMLVVNTDGTFTYTPDANYNGADSFTYSISDGGGGTNGGTGTITILAVNDLPELGVIDLTTDEDTAIGRTFNAGDVDGDTLSYTITNAPTLGTVALSGDSFTYSPNADANGTDSFTYEVSDGNGGVITGTVNLTINAVNDIPHFTNGTGVGVYTMLEDTVLSDVLPQATDPETSSLYYSTATAPAHGTLVVNPDGTFTYTPDENYNGVDSFTYSLSDENGGSIGGTGTITIYAINDVPTLSAGVQNLTTEEDTAVGGLFSADDVDGDSLTYSVTTAPMFGTVTISGNSFTYSPNPDANGTDTFSYEVSDGNGGTIAGTVNISVTAVNDPPQFANGTGLGVYTVEEDTTLTNQLPSASDPETSVTYSALANPAHGTLTVNSDGSFTYTPEANYNGFDSFTYRVSDGTGGTNDSTGTIEIYPANDPPAGGTVNVATDEGVAVSDTFLATDIDGDTLAFELGTAPAHGAVVISGNGFTYTPTADYNGADTFTYVVSDGHGGSITGTVNVTINAVNDAPTVTLPNTFTAVEQTALALHGTGISIGDVDAGTANVEVVLSVVEGTLTATAGSTGVTIAGSSSSAVTLTGSVAAINELLSGSGGATLSYFIDDDTPPASDTLMLAISDLGNAGFGGVLSATNSVTIGITAVNDAPTVVDDNYSMDSNTTLTSSVAAGTSVGSNDSDLDGDTLTYELVTDPAHGTVSFSADGSFTYTPTTGFIGLDHFTYEVADETDTDEGIAWVEVEPLVVTTTGGATLSLLEDGSIALKVTRDRVSGEEVTTFRFSSADGALSRSETTLTATTNVSYAEASDSIGFTFSPDANFNGTAVIMVTAGKIVSGIFEAIATETVNVTVAPVNDAPDFELEGDVTIAMNAGETTVENFLTEISIGPANESAQTFTFTLTSDNPDLFEADHGPQIAIDPVTHHGTLTFTPRFAGSALVTVKLQDNGGTANGGVDVATKTFWLDVTEPVFTIGNEPEPEDPIVDPLEDVAYIGSIRVTTDLITEADDDDADVATMSADGSISIAVNLTERGQIAEDAKVRIWWTDTDSEEVDVDGESSSVTFSRDYATGANYATELGKILVEYVADTVVRGQRLISILVAPIDPITATMSVTSLTEDQFDEQTLTIEFTSSDSRTPVGSANTEFDFVLAGETTATTSISIESVEWTSTDATHATATITLTSTKTGDYDLRVYSNVGAAIKDRLTIADDPVVMTAVTSGAGIDVTLTEAVINRYAIDVIWSNGRTVSLGANSGPFNPLNTYHFAGPGNADIVVKTLDGTTVGTATITDSGTPLSVPTPPSPATYHVFGGILDGIAAESRRTASGATVSDTATVRLFRTSSDGRTDGTTTITFVLEPKDDIIPFLGEADDWTETEYTETIAEGQLFVDVPLTAANDSVAEWDKRYQVRITSINSVATSIDVLGTVTMVDDDHDIVYGTGNVDTESTGLRRDTVNIDGRQVSLADGSWSWSTPFGDGYIADYRSGYARAGDTTFQLPEAASINGVTDVPEDTRLVKRNSYDYYLTQTEDEDLAFLTVNDNLPELPAGGNPNPGLDLIGSEVAGFFGYVDYLRPAVGTDTAGFMLMRRDGSSAFFESTHTGAGTTGDISFVEPDAWIHAGSAYEWAVDKAHTDTAGVVEWKFTGLTPNRIYEVASSAGLALALTVLKGTSLTIGNVATHGFFLSDGDGEIILQAAGEFVYDLTAYDEWTFATPEGSKSAYGIDLVTLAMAGGSSSSDPARIELTSKHGTQYVFDASGLLQSESDASGNQVKYTYESADPTGPDQRLKEIELPGERKVEFSYSTGRLLNAITDPLGRVTTVSGANLISAAPGTDAGTSAAASIQIQATVGQLIRRLDADTTSTPHYSGGVNQTVGYLAPTDSIGELSGYDPANGESFTIYDKFASGTSSVSDLAETWRYQFDRFGLTTAMAAPNVDDQTESSVWKWERDETTGQIHYADRPAARGYTEGLGIGLPSGGYDRIEFLYDDNGRLQYALYDDGTFEEWTYQADNYNHAESYTDRTERVTNYEIDAAGNVLESHVDSLGLDLTTITTYTEASDNVPVGLVKTIQSADDRIATYEYYTLAEGAEGKEKFGKVKSITYSQVGVTGTSLVERFDYDANGYLKWHTTTDMVTTGYRYDRLGQLLETRVGVTVSTIGVVSGGLLVGSYTYNSAGQVRTATTPGPTGAAGSTTTYEYDLYNRLKKTTTPRADDEGTAAITVYTYTYEDRIDTVTDPLGHVTTNYYDSRGRLVKVAESGSENIVSRATGDEYTGTTETEFAYDFADQLKSTTDALDRTTYFTYDADGRKIRTQSPDPDGSGTPLVSLVSRTEFDAAGRIEKQFSPNPAGSGEVYTRNYYDAAGRLVRVQGPQLTAPAAEPTTEDPFPEPTDYFSFTAFEYFDDGRLKTEKTGIAYTEAEGASELEADGTLSDDDVRKCTTTTYDFAGRVESAEIAYQSEGSTLRTATTSTDRGFDSADHVVVSVTDAGGQQTLTTYDQYGRVARVEYPAPDENGPDGLPLPAPVTIYDYFDDGTVKSVTQTYVGGESGPNNTFTSYTYDQLGRPRTATSEGTPTNFRLSLSDKTEETRHADGSFEKTKSNSAGQTIRTEVYAKRATEASDPVLLSYTDYYYDEVGQLYKSVVEDRITTTYGYDDLDRQVSSIVAYKDLTTLVVTTEPMVTTFYTASGMVAATGDDTSTNSFTYDALGRTLSLTETQISLSAQAPLVRTTGYVHDDLGRTEATIDPNGNHTVTTYDSLGRLLSEKVMAADGTTQVGGTATYAYDDDGNLETYVDRNGFEFAYEYDDLDRRTTETWVGDSSGYFISYTYDKQGRVAKVSDPTVSYAYTFDDKDRIDIVTITGLSPAPITLDYEYDKFDRVVKLIDSLGGTQIFNYDDKGRLAQSKLQVGSQSKTAGWTYDDQNRIDTVDRRESGLTNFVRTKFTYAANERIGDIDHQFATGPSTVTSHPVQLHYDYDAQNRLDHYTGPEGTLYYKYDDFDQLIGVFTSEDRTFEDTVKTYAYDEAGNRTHTGDTSDDVDYELDPDANNRLASDETYTYTYDDEGNRETKTEIATGASEVYAWDRRNRLTSVTFLDASDVRTKKIEYRYDAGDHLVSRKEFGATDGTVLGEERYVYQGDVLLFVLDGSGTLQTRQFVVGGEVLGQQRDGQDFEWLLTDRLGSTRALVETDGTVVARYDYDAYGNLTAGSGDPTLVTQLYAGYRYDADTKLYGAHHRWYDAAAGRWISEDPIGFGGGTTNLSEYVGNDPLNKIDPSGLEEEAAASQAAFTARQRQQAIFDEYVIYNLSRISLAGGHAKAVHEMVKRREWNEKVASAKSEALKTAAWVNPWTSPMMASSWVWGQLADWMGESENGGVKITGEVLGDLVESDRARLIGSNDPSIVIAPITKPIEIVEDSLYLEYQRGESRGVAMTKSIGSNLPVADLFLRGYEIVDGVHHNTRDRASYGQELSTSESISKLLLFGRDIAIVTTVMRQNAASVRPSNGPVRATGGYVADPIMVNMGRGYGMACEAPFAGPTAASPIHGLYGPFCRSELPAQVALIEQSGMILGHPPTNFYHSHIPTVQAHPFALPDGATGVQFYTPIKPQIINGQAWWRGEPYTDVHSIPVIVTRKRP